MLLSMGVWFSASAVVPSLTEAWSLNDSGRAWLTMSVQIGFVAGALISALFNLPDRLPAHWMFTVSGILAAASTALIPLVARSLAPALVLRVLTGAFVAGVYPVAMKIIATWTKADRGLGIGILGGALTVGAAVPHLLNAAGGIGRWQMVLGMAAGLAFVGALITILFVREGPYRGPSPRFNFGDVGRVLKNRGVMLAISGYLGHMWELFAMWAWLAAFLAASFAARSIDPRWVSVITFAAISAGGAGSVAAGVVADRVGRPAVTSASLAASGLCAIAIGRLFDAHPAVITAVALVWGFFVVADSAQFSASVSELADQDIIGTALTIQTSMGFMLTLLTIRLIPTLVGIVGWEWAFAFLALGPLVGIGAMQALGRSAQVESAAA